MAKYGHELSAFAGSGLSVLQIGDALNLGLTFVHVNAKDAADVDANTRSSGHDDTEWWRVAGPLLAEVLSEDAHPLASRIGTAAGTARGSGHDPDHAYAFGLGLLMRAIADLQPPAP
ncbi:hypothetical protein [Rhodococcus triatomae]|nr:TetR family transcriptional regulator [Rhodococcus triatomae BKS 15-14]